MSERKEIEEEFWDLRKSIIRFRKILIILAIAGIIIQMYGVFMQYDEDTSFTMEGSDGFVGSIILGTMLFLTGIFFLIRNNSQITKIDKQGDILFGTYDWRLHGEYGRGGRSWN